MPALLSYISSLETEELSSSTAAAVSAPTATTSTTTVTTPAVSLTEALGDGIDFGVVTIWTCPNSCYVSNASEYNSVFREVAIVQQPPDFL
jgi:hypothetical protein